VKKKKMMEKMIMMVEELPIVNMPKEDHVIIVKMVMQLLMIEKVAFLSKIVI
jgi:hypothetical protein